MAKKMTVTEIDITTELFEKMRTIQKIRFTCNGKALNYISEDVRRGEWQSYPRIKIYAQNQGLSLRAISEALGTNYQGFVNACNGRAKFKEEWKPIVAKILMADRKDLFNED